MALRGRGRPLQLAGALMLLAAVTLSVIGPLGKASAAGPTATVTPSTGLVDAQFLSVMGSGFPINTQIQIIECSGTTSSPPLDQTSCDGISLDTQATSDATGNYVNKPGDANGDTGYEVYTLGVPGSTFPRETMTCDAVTPCVLYIGVNYHDFTQPHLFVGITFATSTTPPPTTTTTTTTTVPPGTTTTSTTAAPSTTSSTEPTGSTTSTTVGDTSTSTLTQCVATTSTTATTTGTSTTSTSSTTSTTSVATTSTTTCSTTAATDPTSDTAAATASLPFTGTPQGIPILALGGLIAIGAGEVMRRRAGRMAPHRTR